MNCGYENIISKTGEKHKTHTRAKEYDARRHLSCAQMSNIESGKGNPTLATIEKIAQALGVASDKLLK
jgi:transcriptional regulator with XRE-family HTH domain